jgi:hypothetical protein
MVFKRLARENGVFTNILYLQKGETAGQKNNNKKTTTKQTENDRAKQNSSVNFTCVRAFCLGLL